MSRAHVPNTGVAAALAIHLAVYAGVGCCFAIALWWLLQPKVLENAGLAAYKPPPNTVLTHAGAPGPAILPPQPDASAMATVPAPQAAEVVAPPKQETPKQEAKQETRKETKRREAARNPRPRRVAPEQRDPRADFAYQPSYGFRPWF
jgi:type IV secretory pathway VirB10-like protein